MAQAFPVKAVVQPTGDVVLAEFLESDFVGILDGGIGAGGDASANGLPDTASNEEILDSIKSTMRDNFNLNRFDQYPDYATLNAQTPSIGRFAIDTSLKTFYYGTGEAWLAVGTALTVGGNITGEIEFGGGLETSFDPNTLITSVSVNLTPIYNELDTIELAVGLDTDGSYITPSGTNYIDTSTSIASAVELLDTAIAAERTRAISVEGGILTDINTIEDNLQNFEYAGHSASDVSGANIVGLAYDASTGKFRPETNFGVGGFIKFKKTTGTRDDIPLTKTFQGNNLISGTVAFTFQNGTQDSIDIITNGV